MSQKQNADLDQISVSLTPQREVKKRFKDKEYMNWQRACQTLVMLKEFIEPFMDKKAKQLHEYICARARAIHLIACQKDHSQDKIQRNLEDWYIQPPWRVTSTASQTQTEQGHHLNDALQERQQGKTASSSGSATSSESSVQSTGDGADSHSNRPATKQKRYTCLKLDLLGHHC